MFTIAFWKLTKISHFYHFYYSSPIKVAIEDWLKEPQAYCQVCRHICCFFLIQDMFVCFFSIKAKVLFADRGILITQQMVLFITSSRRASLTSLTFWSTGGRRSRSRCSSRRSPSSRRFARSLRCAKQLFLNILWNLCRSTTSMLKKPKRFPPWSTSPLSGLTVKNCGR